MGSSCLSELLIICYLFQVLHNIAVAEYFQDGCTDPRNLLDALNKVKVSLLNHR